MKNLSALLLALFLVLSFSVISFAEDSHMISAQESLPDGDYRYAVLDDGTAEIFRYFGTVEELVLPETLNGFKVVGTLDDAYFFDDSLTHVSIPDSLVRIGGNPFVECVSLIEITVSADHPTLETKDGVLFSKPDQRLVCYPRALTAESWMIPEDTRIIGDGAFSGCESLTGVIIRDSVTVIGNRAFCVCSFLTDITLPDGVTAIGDAAFSGCLSLNSFTIPDSVVSIGHGAFRSCEALTAIVIPDGITVIEDRTFLGCLSLTGIILPDSITSIGNYAFDSCSALTDIIIPAGVTGIGHYAFSGCSALTDIIIPDGVTSIGMKAFFYCPALTDVIIPDSVVSIGENAFADCDSLTVTVSRGSYAEQYCMENGLRYNYPDENE